MSVRPSGNETGDCGNHFPDKDEIKISEVRLIPHRSPLFDIFIHNVFHTQRESSQLRGGHIGQKPTRGHMSVLQQNT